jgi:signal transduction histidine kinase
LYAHHDPQYTPDADMLQAVRDQGRRAFRLEGLHALGETLVSASGRPYVVIAEAWFDPYELDQLLRFLALTGLFTLLAVALAGWLFSGQALAPIRRVMNEVDAIGTQDMSERLVTEDKQDEISRLVVTFNRLLDRIQGTFEAQKHFLSHVSHEIKNPLTVLTTQAEITLQKDRSPEEYRQTLRSVLDDMRDLNGVAENLMLLARLRSGPPEASRTALRIDELLLQVREAVMRRNPNYRVPIRVEDLPEREEALLVQANEHLLRTAVLNLIENGCKFSPDNTASVRLSWEAGSAVVEISDEGPGIPEEERKRIFDPFYRSARTASAKGSGIGLSLVDAIVKLHGIRMQVLAQDPRGTCFRLEFAQQVGIGA